MKYFKRIGMLLSLLMVMSFVLCACGSDDGKDVAEKWIDAQNEQNWDVIEDLKSNGHKSMIHSEGMGDYNWHEDDEQKSDYELGDYVGEEVNKSDDRQPDDGKVYIWKYTYKKDGKQETSELRTFKEDGEWKAE